MAIWVPARWGRARNRLDMANHNASIAAELAAELDITEERITAALEHAAGADHHDYFGRLAAVLNIELATLYRTFLRLWLKVEANADASRSFVEELRVAAKAK